MDIKMTNIITFGDIHGRDIWKYDIDPENPDNIYVFVGDYVDSWDVKNVPMLENLKNIIEFKRENPDNVILLWGNHDVQYLFYHNAHHSCSGLRPEMAHDLQDIFTKNKDLFQLTYELEAFNEDNILGKYIWSHAGIHSGWYDKIMRQIKDDEKYNQFIEDDMTMSEKLNMLFDLYHTTIFNVSYHRGGRSREGGPLWADFNETYIKPIPGYHQIIGHTERGEIKTYDYYKHLNTSTTYVDCSNRDFYTIKLNIF